MIPLLLLLCEDILRPPLLNEIRDNTAEILKRRAEDKPPGDCLLASDSQHFYILFMKPLH